MTSKRSIVLKGRKTSISLEEPFLRALRRIVREKEATLGQLIAEIDSTREQGSNLSSAIRMFVLTYYLPADEERPPTSEQEISPLHRTRRSTRKR